MTIDQLRLEFEAREIESGAILTRCADGNYLDSAVQGRWEACRFGYEAWAGRVVAWARKWHVDGEAPAKERKENGRWAWPSKFKLLPVTTTKCLSDDVPLCAAPQEQTK